MDHIIRSTEEEKKPPVRPLKLNMDQYDEIFKVPCLEQRQWETAADVLRSRPWQQFLDILKQQRKELKAVTPATLGADFALFDRVFAIWQATKETQGNYYTDDPYLRNILWETRRVIQITDQCRILSVEEACDRLLDGDEQHIHPDTWEIWDDHTCPRHATSKQGSLFCIGKVHPEVQQFLSDVTERQMTVLEAECRHCDWNPIDNTVFMKSLLSNDPCIAALAGSALNTWDALLQQQARNGEGHDPKQPIPALPTLDGTSIQNRISCYYPVPSS